MGRRFPFLAVAVVLPLLPLLAAPRASGAASGPIYWGAHIYGPQYGSNIGAPPDDMRAVNIFAANARKRPSILTFGHSWPWLLNGDYQNFPTEQFDRVRAYGAIPLFTWGSRDSARGVNQPEFRNAAVAAGLHDAYLIRFALAAKEWKYPFFLRLNWEPNGWWYPWGEGKQADGSITNGNRPGDYVKMWRHVHDIFEMVGATNVTWVWSVSFADTSGRHATPRSLYPGDAYVDWVAIDAYNKGGGWLTFNQTLTGSGVSWLSDTYQQVRAVAPNKPVMLSEYASREDPNNAQRKASWIADAHNVQLPENFPEVKAVIWFNWPAEKPENVTLPIESSAAAQSAFADSIASPYFASNSFGGITASPIAPPPSYQTVTLAPTADTYIAADAPATGNGAATTLAVDGAPVKKAFFKFDLRQLQGKVLTSARLSLRTAGPTSGSAGDLAIKLVASTDWSETYMTYNNTVPVSGTILGTLQAIPSDTLTSTNLNLVAMQGRVGSILSLAIDSSQGDDAIFASRESSNPPRLVVTYIP